MHQQTHFTSKGIATESWEHLPKGREGVKPQELSELGLQGNYLSGSIISIKINLPFFFFIIIYLDQILMLKRKLWIGEVKILTEERQEGENTQFHQFGFYST